MSIEGARVKLAESDDEILRCYPIMLQLRPHLKETEFVGRVRSQQGRGGFHLAYASDSSGGPHTVAGFRILENLVQGVFLYVDDLVTDVDDRSKGWGQLLFDWLVDYARAHGCNTLELDSGVQRHGAHRFYLRNRMDITSYHFRAAL
jgi:GNAT superfamily N-acetyltransferase